MKLILMVLLAIPTMLLFNGCAGGNIALNIKQEKILSDKNKAHIVFSRPSNFNNGIYDLDIMEFNIKTFEPKYVGALTSGERVVYSVNEGTYPFYIYFAGIGDFFEITVKNGQVYYVNVGITPITMFRPLVYTEERINLKNEIKSKKCIQQTFDKYLFEEISNTKDNTDSIQSGKKEKFSTYTSPTFMKIECDKEVIVKITDMYLYKSIKELKDEADLVMPSKSMYKNFEKYDKKGFSKDIQEFYPLWKSKFKDVTFTELPLITINKIVDDKYFQSFKSLHIQNDIHDENINKKFINTFDDKLASKILSSSAINDDTLILKYRINKYDEGSMGGRYFTSGFDKKGALNSIGVIDVSIDFYTNNYNLIGSIRVSERESGGIFGGINTLMSDTINVIKDYTTKNFIIRN